MVLALVLCVPQVRAAATKPNVIVILCDDMGYECLSCYGSTSYKTPNLDALATSGIRFKNAYATPLCSPSRVELMTGRYGFHTSWINLIGRGGDEANEYFDPNKEKTFGHILKSAGYATALAGKWQLGYFPEHPNHVKECGFDESCCWTWMIDHKRTSRYWNPSIWQDGKLRQDTKGKYGDDLFADFLIDFIHKHKEEPFFVYYPMALVHEPHTPTPDSTEGHKGKVFDDEEKGKKNREKRAAKLFPGMVAYMDKTVGRLMATLDQLNLRENTLVIFTGDNGTDKSVVSKLGDMSIRGGKGTTTEFGTHVPFIVSWKGKIQPGQVKEDLIDFSDVVPTLAEITGANLPNGVVIDGKSFASQLTNNAKPEREWIFSQLGHERLVRDARLMMHNDGRLYDITTDPFEKQDLSASGDAQIQERKAKLAAVLQQMK